jgi:hypothetical protein
MRARIAMDDPALVQVKKAGLGQLPSAYGDSITQSRKSEIAFLYKYVSLIA